MLERIIAYHCAPALAGIKPANIVSCTNERIPGLGTELERLNKQLNRRGIYLEILREGECRTLIMAYRKNVIETQLKAPEMHDFLVSFGYPPEASVEEYIAVLKNRLNDNDFPHEIGVFLGYPLHDIKGYIHHSDCILTGDWKVYEDAETAEKLFSRYKACRLAISKRLENGLSLAQIFCAA